MKTGDFAEPWLTRVAVPPTMLIRTALGQPQPCVNQRFNNVVHLQIRNLNAAESSRVPGPTARA